MAQFSEAAGVMGRQRECDRSPECDSQGSANDDDRHQHCDGDASAVVGKGLVIHGKFLALAQEVERSAQWTDQRRSAQQLRKGTPG